MERSESITELAAALAKAQANFPAVPKRGEGQVGNQKTQYATLDDVITTVRVPLAENGLSFAQLLDGDANGPTLTTTLMHASGQWIAASTPIDAMNGNRGTNAMQAFGSTLTYLKRYALSAMLGLTADEDDDGKSAAFGNRQQVASKTQVSPPPPPPEPQGGSDSVPGEYLDVVEVGVFETKDGKPHLAFMTEGHKWPDIRWWSGRDALLEEAPWLAQSATKEQLGQMGARYPFEARVWYTTNDKGYKDVVRIERIP